jgi:hypothetical protein
MRICAEWARPSGTNRSPALELPPITCSDDAQAALQTVLEAFGNGEITVRELPVVLGGVERAVRIAERIQQMRERERVGRQIRGELHPGMLPRPVPDPMQAIFDAVARGEDPFPDDPEASAYVATGERLYAPFNSGAEAAPSVVEAPAEGAEPSSPAGDGLYSPVNSNGERTSGPTAEAPSVAADLSATSGDGLYSPVNSDTASAGAATQEGSPEGAAGGGGLYFPVNSSAETPPGAAGRPARAAPS